MSLRQHGFEPCQHSDLFGISASTTCTTSKTGEVSAFLFQPQNSEMKDIQIDRDSFSSIQY
uniref:Uncharacterized protein n=1 Tax=Oryza meridionalis TaxID=40149 RepID=A0A0E0EJE3_9ORYZ